MVFFRGEQRDDTRDLMIENEMIISHGIIINTVQINGHR